MLLLLVFPSPFHNLDGTHFSYKSPFSHFLHMSFNCSGVSSMLCLNFGIYEHVLVNRGNAFIMGDDILHIVATCVDP